MQIIPWDNSSTPKTMDFPGDSFGKLTKSSEFRKALQLQKLMG